MLELKLLSEKPEFVIERLAVKNFDAKEIVSQILDCDTQRRSIQTQLDANLAQQNKAAKSIGALMKEWKREEAEAAEPTEKDCPYCFSKIHIKATRCPHCTAQL